MKSSERRAPVLSDQHALVIGGGISGLLAARVLSEFFARVTVVERDSYPGEPAFRPGTPQSRHPHMLMCRGLRIVEELFPGFEERVLSRGAQSVDLGWDLWTRLSSGWLPRERLPHLRSLICTRYLVEWQIRQEVALNPRVRLLEKHEVIGLLSLKSRLHIVGVRLRERGSGEKENRDREKELMGDLVVDASGRDSRLPQWLEEQGYPAPSETVVDAYLGYATRFYTPPSGTRPAWKSLFIQPALPDNPRSGIICPIENGQWQVLLSGANKEYPPTEDAAYLEFARGLADPLLYEALREAQPSSPIYSYRHTRNRLRHYEKLGRWPGGLIVLGDAACALNPIYGQGMSVAAQGALLLRDTLRQQSGRRGRAFQAAHFQRKLARLNALPWQFATHADARTPLVSGSKPARASRFFMDRLVCIVPTSAFARQRFLEVQHMLRSPSTLLHPLVLLALLRPASFRPRQEKR